MSNLEKDPPEFLADCIAADDAARPGIEILTPRDVPLGGPRAMRVRRTLPQRERSAIGAWCFLDHYGPEDVSITGGMRVPPHPHTGLQTVSWLFAGEIEHRDSVGSRAMVRPGELNLMTAGRGISHSEVSTHETSVLHGVQLWTALPDETRNTHPFFEHFIPPPIRLDTAEVRVFVGELAGQASTASAFSPLIGAQIDLPAGADVVIPVRSDFEHGVLVDSGDVRVEELQAEVAELAYLAPGRRAITVAATSDARIILIGGTPLGEQLIMWWNFIGRSHEEIVEYRAAWQHDVTDDHDSAGRFGHVRGYDGHPLPAPAMPGVRLRPRR